MKVTKPEMFVSTIPKVEMMKSDRKLILLFRSWMRIFL